MLDYKILNNVATVSDFDRAQKEFELKKQLLQAQTEAEKKKLTQVDVDKLGEQAFMKAAMGAPLSKEEQAAAMFLDAKSGGTTFNPVTGELYQKPRISDKIGIGMAQGGVAQGPVTQGTPRTTPMQLPPVFDGVAQEPDEFELAFQEQMAAAQGNPKLQQQIQSEYRKNRLEMNEAQSKAAGFYDRALDSLPVIKENQAAGLSLAERTASAIPVIGNYMVSDEYQKLDQAQRDFINAILRRESGAVISPQEFDNARKQYFPQPGDSEKTLAQKEKNRKTSAEALKSSAGSAYRGKSPEIDYKSNPRIGDVVDGYLFMGGDHLNEKNWKQVMK